MAITSLLPWKHGEKNVAIQRADNPVYSLQREMNRLFDDFFPTDFGLAPFKEFGPGEGFGAFSPSVDIAETDKEIKVSTELPGLSEDDIEVSLSGDTLTISGEKKAEKEDKGKNYYRMERSYGSFRRAIPLPCEVETDKVNATFKKGVLNIVLPKTSQAQEAVKKIAIRKG
ncbi:MAG TPA: Hsp20/alpha crystallin family protein [Chloroflexi bacterium]|nr:MAG: hypothetical protein B6243_01465 [Anaerolineaceae bacterium 4572_5.2]HEY84791.1 Hsp20/alpha crystallin family protein [Chloroflexota bacterium]